MKLSLEKQLRFYEMMLNNKEVLYSVLKIFDELSILDEVILVGSWVEMFYEKEFSSYLTTMKTYDIDFYIPRIKKDKEQIDLIGVLDDEGFVYYEDILTRKSKFFGKSGYEIEFLANLTRLQTPVVNIPFLRIYAESLPYLDIIQNNVMKVKIINPSLEFYIPTPGAYIIHKLVINEDRKEGKKLKDIEAIKNLLPYVKNNHKNFTEMIDIFNKLSIKSQKKINNTCEINGIELFET